MSVIADLIRAGVDPDLVARVADEMAEARALGALVAAPMRTARQERNRRYYEKKASEKRLNASEQDVLDAPDEAQEKAPHTPKKDIHPPKENPPKGGQKKGSRLSEDWQPTDDDRLYGRRLGFPDGEIDRMAEDMRLWAVSANGPNATKRDWSSAFKGWMRREIAKTRASPNGRRKGASLAELAFPELREPYDEQPSDEYHSSSGTGPGYEAASGFAGRLSERPREDSGGVLLDFGPARAMRF